MKSPRKFLRKCIRKIRAGLQVGLIRAERICGTVLEQKLARKRAFARTKARAR